jgi:integrase
MARQSTSIIYYKRAFDNARRCLQEARASLHPYSKNVIRLKNPSTGSQDEVMSISSAIKWCVKHHLPTWATSTWRLTRGGYKLLLNKMRESGRIDEEAFQLLMDYMQTAKGLSKKDRNNQTSSRRKKLATPEHIRMIEEHISQKNNKWGESLVIWLKAAIATGLRPNEWRTVSLKDEDGRIILRSDNFKYNEERSYAPFRELELTKMDPITICFIRQQVAITEGMKDANMTELHYLGCSDLLLKINRKLWPKRKANITLYTGRHQFSANAKADDDCSEEERAAMMGHKTTQTSREGYGKRRSGSKGLTPEIADKTILANIRNPKAKRPGIKGPNNDA